MRGVKRRKTIHAPMIPGRTWTDTGETVKWGKDTKVVYKELKPLAERSELRVDKDAEGRPMSHYDGSTGRRGLPTRYRVLLWPDPNDKSQPDLTDPRNWREFIHINDGNGNSSKNFHFREDPAVVARKQQEAERKAKWDKLMDSLDPDALIEAMAGADDGEAPKRRGRPPKVTADA